MPLDLRLGIDVGGTNTDAVILDRDGRLLAKAKRPSTADGVGGIVAAVDALLADPAVEPGRITHVMLGTTQATNALVERTRLRKVAVIRIGAPMTTAVPPLLGWPAELRKAVSAGEIVVGGGHELDGSEIAALDEDAIATFLTALGDRAEGVAITSVFSPVSPDHELAAAKVVRRVLGDVPVSLSHQVGAIGLLERENATVLNATLTSVLNDLAASLDAVLADRGLTPILLFAQNDGTLMAIDHALEFPVLTIGSGPANSIRGAAHLTGLSDALVIDVGGTTTDIGALVGGYPRQSANGVEIGGIRTNFAMPDLLVVGVGGGTVVYQHGGRTTVGPDSVGYRLSEMGLCFGGTVATLSDALVAAGRVDLGGEPISADWHPLLTEALDRSGATVCEAVDRMKLSPAALPAIAIGGGSALVPDLIPGISQVLRPEHYEVANAVGAAIAFASGQAETMTSARAPERGPALTRTAALARERAIAAGADPARLEVIEQEEIPLAYLTEPVVRIRIKMAGPLWTG